MIYGFKMSADLSFFFHITQKRYPKHFINIFVFRLSFPTCRPFPVCLALFECQRLFSPFPFHDFYLFPFSFFKLCFCCWGHRARTRQLNKPRLSSSVGVDCLVWLFCPTYFPAQLKIFPEIHALVCAVPVYSG